MVRWAIRGSKKNVKANIRPKKAAESFSKGSLKEPMLNASFNNGSRHKTVVKDSV
jgi:hypothetical protein